MAILFVFLNYFWLSKDPKENASWYCDQHAFKIHSEVIASVWDAVLELAPWIGQLADEEEIPKTYRTRIHARPGQRWHPLSAWNAISYGNCLTSLINARELLLEHEKRTTCQHKVWKDWRFLWKHIHEVSFSPNSKHWREWKERQFPDTPVEELTKAFEPIPVRGFDLEDADIPMVASMTKPPVCINTKIPDFQGCVSSKPGFDGIIEAYRKYYEAKTGTISGGMRYYHSDPPGWMDWIRDKLKCKRSKE